MGTGNPAVKKTRESIMRGSKDAVISGKAAPHVVKEESIRILIVDDYRIMRQGLRMLIEAKSGMQVVGEAGNHHEALMLASREKPDIIVLEVNLNGGGGLELLSELVSVPGGAKIIVLTGLHDPAVHRQAVRLGATGLVLKDQADDMLIRAIRKVHAGEAWLDRKITASVISEISRPRLDQEGAKIASLTAREREIITVVCEGLKNRQIAEKCFISEATVRNHLTSILSKLGLGDRFELALYAYRHNLAKLPPSHSWIEPRDPEKN
jgi:DNA-binding NarL/FixJ family response regulator